MKSFNVELKYTSYVLYSVEANTKEEAEDKAWEMLNDDAAFKERIGNWEMNNVQEVKE